MMPIVSDLNRVLALITQEKKRKSNSRRDLEAFLDELIGWIAEFFVYEEYYFDYRFYRDDKDDIERLLNKIAKLKDHAISLCDSKLTTEFGLGALQKLLLAEALYLPHVHHPLPKLTRGHTKNSKIGYFVIMLDSLLKKHSLLITQVHRLRFIELWLKSFFGHWCSLDGVKKYLKNYEFWRPTFGMDGKTQFEDVMWLLRNQKERRVKDVFLFLKKLGSRVDNFDDDLTKSIIDNYIRGLPNYREKARSKIEKCFRKILTEKGTQIR